MAKYRKRCHHVTSFETAGKDVLAPKVEPVAHDSSLFKHGCLEDGDLLRDILAFLWPCFLVKDCMDLGPVNLLLDCET